MRVTILSNMGELELSDWARLQIPDSPFLNYDFLSALEKYDCVGEATGWIPMHLRIDDESGIAGFMPLYLKYNSYGELVFDWSWADAFHQQNIPYYPKLVSAIPYTPVTGPRLLTRADLERTKLISFISEWLQNFLAEKGFSSFHCLFAEIDEIESFQQQGMVRRLGCQFHWRNNNYESFEHFLSFFASRKRKNVKKERQLVHDTGFEFKTLKGDEIEPDLWPTIYEFYQITFYKKSGFPTFTLAFFQAIARLMPEKFLVNLVIYQGKFVACAILYRDSGALYGRHWGCFAEYKNLHFETCYYQGLEYAIDHGLQLFEPGAQGEHKISRGFLPTATWSVHWINNPVFSSAIKDFTLREEKSMNHYMSELATSSPYKS